MALRYTIKVSKDHAQVKATWDISVDESDTEIIDSFVLKIEEKTVDTQCSGGNKACKGAQFVTLQKPNKECPVTSVITTSKPDVRNDSDSLRAGPFDDVDFAG